MTPLVATHHRGRDGRVRSRLGKWAFRLGHRRSPRVNVVRPRRLVVVLWWTGEVRARECVRARSLDTAFEASGTRRVGETPGGNHPARGLLTSRGGFCSMTAVRGRTPGMRREGLRSGSRPEGYGLADVGTRPPGAPTFDDPRFPPRPGVVACPDLHWARTRRPWGDDRAWPWLVSAVPQVSHWDFEPR